MQSKLLLENIQKFNACWQSNENKIQFDETIEESIFLAKTKAVFRMECQHLILKNDDATGRLRHILNFRCMQLIHSKCLNTQMKDDNLQEDFYQSDVKITLVKEELFVELLQRICQILRLLRNLCIQNSANQEYIYEKYLDLIVDFLDLGLNWKQIEETRAKQQINMFCWVCTQCLGNIITQNKVTQDWLWQRFFPVKFNDFLVNVNEDRKLLSYFVMILHNCLINSEEHNTLLRSSELVDNKAIIATLLQRCLQKSSDKPSQMMNNSVNDPAFDWINLLFRLLFKRNFFPQLYEAVSASCLSRLWSTFTPEQILLLHVVQGILNTDISIDLRYKTFHFLSEKIAFLASSQDIKGNEEDDGEFISADRKDMVEKLEDEGKKLLFDMIGTLTSNIEDEKFLHNSIIEVSINELKSAWEKSSSSRHNRKTNSNQDAKSVAGVPVGYKSSIIRVLGNLAYRNEINQNKIREFGGIPMILTHCNIEDTQPFIREWSLVALRNLCEGNIENQQFIEKLKPQGVQSEVDLSKYGVTPTLSEDGKKVKLSRNEN